MAKSPRKGAAGLKTAAYSQKLNPKVYKTPKYGGKNFKAYNYHPQRRWSIVESSSDSSGNEAAALRANKDSSGSESESSLTAMSENDESHVSRRGSVFFEGASTKKTKPRKTIRGMKTARKRVPKKMPFKNQAIAESSSDDDDDSDDDEDSQHINDYFNADDDAEDSDENAVGLGGIYSMINTHNSSNNNAMYTSSESDSDSNSKSDSADEDDNMSSSDDSEVDFVQLQAERRAKSMKSLRAIKGLQKPKQKAETAPDHKKQRRGSLYRRKSEVALPDDINFKFEFDDANSTSILDEDADADNDDNAANSSNAVASVNEEEDIGEVVGGDQSAANADFHFDEPLMHVPKFKDDEFNSDEEYEFDDNDLLATLQADNDIDEFITGGGDDLATPRTRQGSLSSVNDDTEDPFLREEEKYLVNEFETNGFDDEEDPARIETARVMNSFKTNNAQREQVVQYASSSDDSQFGEDLELSQDENDYGDDDGDVDDYMDFIDFAEPIVDKRSDDDRHSEKSAVSAKSKPHFSKKHRRKGPLDSEEEDDSYLWNYFFSSDADSPDELENESFAVEEQLMLEEIFRQNVDEKKNTDEERISDSVDQDQEYDSGDSTDVDLSLPPSSGHNQGGSKMAKEVLSSKTADYRPPVLGTWIAIESKPFGIIDGLSTRTLNSQTTSKNPRGKGWKNITIKNDSEDLAIELNELLNISELDNDDENDVRIWRDFNNNKKHVPLGAFRNKLHMNPPMAILEPMAGFNSKIGANFAGSAKFDASLAKVQKQNRSKPPASPASAGNINKKVNLPSKQRRQRASIADAVSEGFRPTKSGLFSENVLADVEDVLGDDREFMALIKGL